MPGERRGKGAREAGPAGRRLGGGPGGGVRAGTTGVHLDAPIRSVAPPILSSIFPISFRGVSPRPRRCLGSRSLSLVLLQTTTSRIP